MKHYLICTPIRPKLSHDGAVVDGIAPQETTFINMDLVAYAMAAEYYVERTGETWEYFDVTMVDGMVFKVLATDWSRWQA